MDATHIHLLLNHFPIVGTIIGVGILIYGLVLKNESIQKVALLTFVAMAILTIPVFLSGEEAEEAVEHLAGVSEHLIEEHEELAEKAIWLLGILGVLALIGLYAIVKKQSFAKAVTIITLIVSVVTFGFFVVVGNSGGQIRHSEIRTEGSDSIEKYKEDIQEIVEEEDHDDDD